ncbi:uncharacterized protein LOC101857896 [Aplysia californica]|uniref:Sex-determining region Y protein n=1 Tax=Aplysia californica TaxID=6500 RepID=A0ABM0K0L1_APLCA|nr:uncharacterized protein LOC101857896 [Aplysia californica]
MELPSPVPPVDSSSFYPDVLNDDMMRPDYFDSTHTFMDFDEGPYSTYDSNDIVMDMGSPDSASSEDALDSVSVASSISYDFGDLPATPTTPSLEKQSSVDSYTDEKFRADVQLMRSRWAPHEPFPNTREWTLEEKAAELLRMSPCTKYSVDDLVNVNQLENPEDKVTMLIDVVAGIRVPFRWNFVDPKELFKSYTVVTNCKKEKPKKDKAGQLIPKRPMNAFMIWCQKCRTLMAHICPQLHNAIISKVLGAVWRRTTKEDKELYEAEKKKLMLFHKEEFPDYKYRPKKKPKKAPAKSPNANPALGTPASKKSKSKSKKKEKGQQSAPGGIGLTDTTQQIVHPVVRERLQVKIDPDFKRGMGKRSTAIDLADLPCYQQSQISPDCSVSSPSREESSVFDTPDASPENSPSETRTSPSPHYNEQSLSPHLSGGGGSIAFKFEPGMYNLPVENNNNVPLIMAGSGGVMTIKSEPGTLSSAYWHTQLIKSESVSDEEPVEALTIADLPVLGSDVLHQYLHLEANQEISKSEMSVYLNEAEQTLDNFSFQPACFWPSAVSIKVEDTTTDLAAV